MSGDREVRFMFNKLRLLIDRTYILKEEIQEDWERVFDIKFILVKLPELLKDIDRFQNLYNVDSKLRIGIELFLENILNKFKIETEEIESKPSIIEIKIDQWIRSKLKKLNLFEQPPITEKSLITQKSGKFTENPIKDFIDLYKQAETIYHHYFQKYSIPELDVLEINLGPCKIRTRKNWKAITGTIFVWIFYTCIVLAVGTWIGFSF